MWRKAVIQVIKFYQLHIRGFLPGACRFWPSCSEYSAQAIDRYGLGFGMLKGIKRILHCHPFSGKSGYDPLV